MADSKPEDENSRFRVALELMEKIERAEMVFYDATMKDHVIPGARLATREWILRTYVSCLAATWGRAPELEEVIQAKEWLQPR